MYHAKFLVNFSKYSHNKNEKSSIATLWYIKWTFFFFAENISLVMLDVIETEKLVSNIWMPMLRILVTPLQAAIVGRHTQQCGLLLSSDGNTVSANNWLQLSVSEEKLKQHPGHKPMLITHHSHGEHPHQINANRQATLLPTLKLNHSLQDDA